MDTMNTMNEEHLHLQTISSMLQDENRIVTFKLLSRTLGIDVNCAKILLSKYLSSKHPPSLFTIYYISGLTNENMILATAVNEDDLENMKRKFKKLNSVHVYGIMPAKLDGAIEALINVDIQVARNDTPSSLAKARLIKNDKVEYSQRVSTNGISNVLNKVSEPQKVKECHIEEKKQGPVATKLSKSGSSSAKSTNDNSKGQSQAKSIQKSFFGLYKPKDKSPLLNSTNNDLKSTEHVEVCTTTTTTSSSGSSNNNNKNKRDADCGSGSQPLSKKRRQSESNDRNMEHEEDEEMRKIALLAAQNSKVGSKQQSSHDEAGDVDTVKQDDDDEEEGNEDMPIFADDEDDVILNKEPRQPDAVKVNQPAGSDVEEPIARRVKKTRKVLKQKQVYNEKTKVMTTTDVWVNEEYSEDETVSAPKLKRQSSSSTTTTRSATVIGPGDSSKSKGGDPRSLSPPLAKGKGGGAKKGGKKKDSGAGQKSLLSFLVKG